MMLEKYYFYNRSLCFF